MSQSQREESFRDLLPMRGFGCDVTQFVADHATDETPTTIEYDMPLAQWDELADRLMAKAGYLFNGIEYVKLGPMFVLVNDLVRVEAEEILGEPIVGLAVIVQDTEPLCSAERDQRRQPEQCEDANG